MAVEGSVRKVHGEPAQVESATTFVQATDIELNEETGEVRARGNVYFRSFKNNEQLWADHVVYDTEAETGQFFDVRGETHPRIDARPGILTSTNPFYFQGEWAERLGNRYILYNGFVTNCKMPRPWWRLRGPKFIIEPGHKATAYHATFLVRRFPLFYAPFFYHSLEREPRKSGFLIPNAGHSSRRGWMVGLGYFWAINRSYDVTYQFQDYTARGLTHHIDFRGKPSEGSDFDAIIYGVQDRGLPDSGNPPQKFSGVSAYVVGRSDLGGGWTARGAINYISSFRFRQEWTESYNEAIGSEIHSVGFVNKNWSSYTFDGIFERMQNFQRSEIPVADPVTNAIHYVPDAVTIRKLPEAQFAGRDRQLWKNLPVWFSFESAAGLLYRDEPVFNGDVLIDHFQTGQFMNRVNFAPRVTTAFHWAGIHLIPSFGIDETYYAEAQGPFQDRYRVVGTNIVRSARDFSLDLIFPTLTRVFQKKTVFGDKLKHVIEPRATYRYVTGIGEDFTRFIRFDETDLLSDTNELELSLTNRIYAKRGDSVQEIFSWQLWQKRYFDPTFGGALIPGQRNVVLSTAELTPYAFLLEPRSSSPVVSVLRMSPITGLGVEWRADYDHRRGEIVDTLLSLDYRRSKYYGSIGEYQVHTDPILTAPANQIVFRGGFGEPNHRGWNAGVTGIYDYHAKPHVLRNAIAQVTYNTDCCGLSFQYGRFSFGTRNENQFRVAFAVANIGTFGNLRRQEIYTR
ncbi:MAG TPA: LPS assembly protein LptD [Bryobacteraceae bacterium]